MKRFIAFVIVVCCFVGGCAQKYKTVEEYANAMRAVQQAQKSYTLELEHLTSLADNYYRVYKKNNLWKTALSANNGRNFMYNTLFDGKDVLGYGNNASWATILNPNTAGMDGQDVSVSLFNWDKPLGIDIHNNKPQFINHKERKNGFDCRLIKYGNSYEVCVNDTLGIAVYMKNKIFDNFEIEINVVKADTSELPDSTFVLPNDKQKITPEQLLKNLSKQGRNKTN